MVPSWWRRLVARPSRPPRRRDARLILETLEDRLTPAVHTWTGLSTSSANWSDPANWDVGAPTAGERNVVLNFGPISNPSQLNTVDDIGGLSVQQINFTTGGYTLNGTPFLAVTDGISDQSAASGSSSTTTAPAPNAINLGITLAGQVAVQVTDPGVHLQISGRLIGPGGLTKLGAGSLDLTTNFSSPSSSQGNAYGGPTAVNAGVLNLEKFQAVPGPLTIGDGVGGPNADRVFIRTSDATGSAIPVTIRPSGQLVLGDGQSQIAFDTIASLDMTGGEVLGSASSSSGSSTFTSSPSASTLTLAGGGVTVHASATTARIDANLDLGGKTQTFNVEPGGDEPGLLVTGVISDSGFASSFPITPVIPSADLSVAKMAPPTTGAGALLTYTLSVSNAGPTDAPNVSLTDVVPQGTTFVSVGQTSEAAPSFSCSTMNANGVTTVVCSTGDLGVSQFAIFDLVVQVNAGAANGSTITNTANVTSSASDPNTGNNSSTATTTVDNQADLWVRIPNPPQLPATSGNPITYTITVTNLGPASAAAVTLTDSFPGATFSSVSQTGGSDSFTCSGPGPNTPTQVSCTAPTVAVGATDTFEVVVTPPVSPTNLTNTATVSASGPDPNADNNTAVVTTGSQAGLTVTKTGPASGTATPGDLITYSISVSNSGPSPAENVELTDMLPAGTSFVSESQTGGTPTFTCLNPTSSLDCFANDLAANQTATFQLVAAIDSGATGSISNVALGVATNASTTITNSSTATTTLTPAADLGVLKSGPARAGRGQTINYDISLTNLGPSDAQNVTVTDTLPANATFDSAFGTAGFTCGTPSGGVLTCTAPSLAAHTSADITVQVTVSAQAADNTTLTDIASVSSGTPDSDSGNDTSSATTTVAPTADLGVNKTGPSTATPGQNITYALTVSNNGPDAAPSVSLTDSVPFGTTFVSAVQTGGPDGFSCQGPGAGKTGTITCTAATVPSGHTDTFQVVVNVNSSASSEVGNFASVSSSAIDTNSQNDNSSVFTSIPSSPSGGGAGLTKAGGGTLVLTAANTYKGPTTVNAGVLLVDGSQPGSPAFVNAGGLLGGGGTLGPTTVNAGGVLSPEDSAAGSPSLLTVSGDVTFQTGAVFLPRLAGTAAGSGYSVLKVTGSAILGGAFLRPVATFQPKDTDTFTLIALAGSGQVTGLFRSAVGQHFLLEEGAVVPGLNTMNCFTVSYLNGAVKLIGVNNEELFVRAVYAGLGLVPDNLIPGYVKQLQNSNQPLQQARAAVVRAIYESTPNLTAQVNAFFQNTNFQETSPNVRARVLQQLKALHAAGQVARHEGDVFVDFIVTKEFKQQFRRPKAFVLDVYQALLNKLPTRRQLREGVAQVKQGKLGRVAFVTKLLSSNAIYTAALLHSFNQFLGLKPNGTQSATFKAEMKSGAITAEDLVVTLTTDPQFVNTFLKHFMALCENGMEAL